MRTRLLILGLGLCLSIDAFAEASQESATAKPDFAGSELSELPSFSDGWRIGAGARFPDGLPLELIQGLSASWRLRFWLSPPLGLVVDDAQEGETESFFDSVAFATPATKVRAKVDYGPALGLEGLYRPLASDFYLGFGASYYELVGRAQKSTPLMVCFDVSKPCNASTAPYKTRGELDVRAKVREQGIRLALAAGWLWDIGDSAYLNLSAGGLSAKVWQRQRVDVISGLGDDPALSDLAKEQVRYVLPDKEENLKSRILEKMDQYNRTWLPLLGLSFGFRF